jgi:hypothetical protein
MARVSMKLRGEKPAPAVSSTAKPLMLRSASC